MRHLVRVLWSFESMATISVGLVPGTSLKDSFGPMRARGGPAGLGSGGVSERIMGLFRFEADRRGSTAGFDSVAASDGIEGSLRFATERERMVCAFFDSSTAADITEMVGCVRDFGIRIDAGRRGIARTVLGSLTGIGEECAV